jgi:hypothetical protein
MIMYSWKMAYALMIFWFYKKEPMWVIHRYQILSCFTLEKERHSDISCAHRRLYMTMKAR